MTKFYTGQQGLKTRSGHDVKIYEVYEDEIHGAYFNSGKWHNMRWSPYGGAYRLDLDIIAPVETVVRYVNVYRTDLGGSWESLIGCEEQDKFNPNCIARWKITYEPDNPEKPPVVEVIWSKDK